MFHVTHLCVWFCRLNSSLQGLKSFGKKKKKKFLFVCDRVFCPEGLFFPVRHACLSTLKLCSCQCVMANQTKSQLPQSRRSQWTPCLSLIRSVSPPTFHPSNKSPFLKNYLCAVKPWHYFRDAPAEVCWEADKEVHTSSRLVSKLTAHQEEAAAD